MSGRDVGFYLSAAGMLSCGLAAVTLRDLFKTVMAFLGLLLFTAVLFLVLEAETVALVQVMVYIGGVMIFLLYGVLLTSELGGKTVPCSGAQRIAALVGCASLATLLILAIWALPLPVAAALVSTREAPPTVAFAPIADLGSIGMRLLDPGPEGFLLPFELISVLLLGAAVGAIALTRSRALPKQGNLEVSE